MADIVLINPRFDVSYWGLEHALPLFGKRANMPVACLPLLAALTPDGHSVTLIDENVEPIDFERCARADIVGVTGMSVQRRRMHEILTELKRRDTVTVVGGPWVTVEEHYFGDLADHIFIGEAEETWPAFLQDWSAGRAEHRYEQAVHTDMSAVPVPRFDLLSMRHYAFGSVQFSRGCPFTCEFCDIIVIFGRRPRIKSTDQIIRELEALREQRVEMVFIVDDNLIGNKKAIKAVLRDVAAWQEANGYPFIFFTEASLDLAEDEELMGLMIEANILAVFIGIESPNEASLRETRKLQNVRGGMLERVRRIQDAGIEIWCGMIVGFDNDDLSIFEAQRRFIEEARIVHAMIGMLVAIPKTPLYARLLDEGRLDPADQPAFGTNVIPRNMSQAELLEGYSGLMARLYEPAAYFDRADSLYIDGQLAPRGGQIRYWQGHRWRRWQANAKFSAGAVGLYLRLMRTVSEASLRREYKTRLKRIWSARHDPFVLLLYVIKCAMHYHAHVMVRRMAANGSVINSF